MPRKRLGELLVEAKVLDPSNLETALAEHRRSGDPLGHVLVGMGMVSEEVLVRALSHQLNLPAVQLDEGLPADEALALLDYDFCRQHCCIPFGYHARGHFLDVALADPTNQDTYDEIRVRTKCNVRPHLAGPMAIDRLVRRAYGKASSLDVRERIDSASLERIDPLDSMPEVDVVVVDTPPDPDDWNDDTLSAYIPTQAADPDSETVPLDFNNESPESTGHAGSDKQLSILRAEVREMGQMLLGQIDGIRALVERDEVVLRRLLAMLVEKGLCTREELTQRLTKGRDQA